jgi:O-succinylbenzoate synthase
MRIDRVDVIHTAIPLKSSFRTSFGAISAQHSVVTKVYSEGLVAYGEACPFLAPIYSYECVGSVQTVLGSFIIRLERPWPQRLSMLTASSVSPFLCCLT